MHDKKREKIPYQRKKTSFGRKKQVGKVKRLREKFLGKRKECFCWEKWEKKIAQKLYIEKRSSLDRELLRIYRALILDRFSCRSAIESYQWQRKLDGSNSYRGAIEQIESFLMDRESIETNSRKLRWIEIALTSVEKGRSKILMDS